MDHEVPNCVIHGPMVDNEKLSLLKTVSLFSKLKDHELETVARYSGYHTFSANDNIFHEGSVAEELYIIRSGEVVISKRAGEGDQVKVVDIARFIEGDCFGELGMLDSKPRNESATATRDTTLLIFPDRAVKFRDLIVEQPSVFAQILHKLLAIIAGRIRTTNNLVSEKSPWMQDLRRQLLGDELTGLYNRLFLDEELATLLPGYGAETSLLMIKPDNFKLINDTYGHDAGDRVLKQLAETISSSLRSGDVPVRYRGNEIGAVLPGTSTETAAVVAETVRAAVPAMDVSDATDGEKVVVTVSVGIATFPRHAENHKRLVELAFEKMFEAREQGGDRVHVAHSDTGEGSAGAPGPEAGRSSVIRPGARRGRS